MNTEMTDVSTLPTIPDTNSWDIVVTRAEQLYMDTGIWLRACWRDYRTWIIFCLTALLIGIFIVVVIILQSKPSSNPCLIYQSDTLASSVSVECLQYMWNGNCRLKQSYLFPQGYTGWWRQSPQGGTMVSCHISPGACGVGSYGNIMVYMQFCQINYNQ